MAELTCFMQEILVWYVVILRLPTFRSAIFAIWPKVNAILLNNLIHRCKILIENWLCCKQKRKHPVHFIQPEIPRKLQLHTRLEWVIVLETWKTCCSWYRHWQTQMLADINRSEMETVSLFANLLLQFIRETSKRLRQTGFRQLCLPNRSAPSKTDKKFHFLWTLLLCVI